MISREKLDELIDKGATIECESFEEEVWKVIDGFDGRYSISNYGNVRANDYTIYHSGRKEEPHFQKIKGKILASSQRNDGYIQIRLVVHNGCRKCFLVHRLVAKMFVNNPENKLYVNHIDGNKLNNYYKNLEWVTGRENNLHAYKIGLSKITDKMRESARERTKKLHILNCKKVYQYDTHYHLINSYTSIKEASRVLHIPQSSISRYCRNGRETSYGYIFLFDKIKENKK